jgi:methyltransferase family protein
MGLERAGTLSESVTPPDLSAFEHRTSYDEVTGRDRWEVRIVNAWIRATLPPLLATVAPGPVIDAGCGEQPFRALVEANARQYVGMDAIQNRHNSVAVLSDLESVPATGPRYPFVLCTEVLEHVVDIDRSFQGLRRLTAPGGIVVLTVPFIFPVHMEPFDFRRLTVSGISQLAADHGFEVVSFERLGRATDGLATLLADASVLPATRAPYDRVKARLLRMAKSWLVHLLDSPALSSHVSINTNYYLCNGVVLKAS